MQISFYVLSEHYAPSASSTQGTVSGSEAVLNFVCKLTQTVLTKSEHSLVIIDDDLDRLAQLDEQLWSFDAVSFIPHDLLIDIPLDSDSDTDLHPVTDINDKLDNEDLAHNTSIRLEDLSAPVTLLPVLPQGFDGVVLNLAAMPLMLENSSSYPERVLEIITPDDTSKEQGRDKYRYYQQLDFELIYHPIK